MFHLQWAWAQQVEKAVPSAPAARGEKGAVVSGINEANKKIITDPAASSALASQALQNAMTMGDKSAEYHACNTLGALNYNNGNYPLAAQYFQRAAAGFEKLKDEKNLAFARKYLSICLEKQKLYKKAEVVESKQYEANAKVKNPEYYQAAKRKATMKGKSGNKAAAIQELEVLKADKKLPPDQLLDIYAELGELYLQSKDTVKALTYLNSAALSSVEFKNADASQFYNTLNEKNLMTGRLDENLAMQQNLYSNALKTNDPMLLLTANYNLGSTYLAKGDYAAATSFLGKSYELGKATGKVEVQEKSIRDLSLAYEKMGNYQKALQSYKQYVVMLDSIRNKKLNDEVERQLLSSKFNIQSDRIKLLEEQQKDREIRLTRQRRTIWFLIGGLAVLGALVYGLVTNIKQKQKANLLVRLQSLRTQMNPHFIFNSLNSVNNFIAKNDERSANKYLSDFSKLMRAVLKNSDMNFIPLETEISTLELYLGLEHFRFNDKFDFRLEVSDDIDKNRLMVPPMLVQPYIENAIWHGLRYKEDKGLLNVRFFLEKGQLVCTVHDNGIGRKKSAELKTEHQKGYQSTGIRNTKERIEILNRLHKTALDIKISDLEMNGEPTGTLVRITLPYVLTNENAA